MNGLPAFNATLRFIVRHGVAFPMPFITSRTPRNDCSLRFKQWLTPGYSRVIPMDNWLLPLCARCYRVVTCCKHRVTCAFDDRAISVAIPRLLASACWRGSARYGILLTFPTPNIAAFLLLVLLSRLPLTRSPRLPRLRTAHLSFLTYARRTPLTDSRTRRLPRAVHPPFYACLQSARKHCRSTVFACRRDTRLITVADALVGRGGLSLCHLPRGDVVPRERTASRDCEYDDVSA